MKAESNLSGQPSDRSVLYERKLVFLWDLIKNFTEGLGIKDRKFYRRVGSEISKSEELTDVDYGEHGLDGFPAFLRNYRGRSASDANVYVTATRLGSLSRLISVIFVEASKSVGTDRAKEVFLKSFSDLRKKYDDAPDLSSYMPEGLVRSESELSVTNYPTMVMDDLIDYLADDVISKWASGKKLPVQAAKKSEPSVDNVKGVYLDMLGPIGTKWFGRLKTHDERSVADQVSYLVEKSILTPAESDEFMRKIRSALGARSA